jgi:WXXGXW repeat (2 copies)
MLRRSLLVFAFAAACGSSSPLGTQTTVPDPPAAEEDKPAHERPDFFWIHGHWVWNGNRWDWTSGHWEHERKGYVWSEGHWDKHDGRWAYTDGAWTAGEAPASPPPATGP